MTDGHVSVPKRGRPPKGDKAMSAAARKRAQRMRDSRAAIIGRRYGFVSAAEQLSTEETPSRYKE